MMNAELHMDGEKDASFFSFETTPSRDSHASLPTASNNRISEAAKVIILCLISIRAAQTNLLSEAKMPSGRARPWHPTGDTNRVEEISYRS
jgi:hypothetical protein